MTPFVKKFRYAILAALLVLTIGYGYYLYRLYVPAPPPPSVTVVVMVDGSIRIDGALYQTPEKLRPKVELLQKEHPGVGFTISAAYGSHFEPTAKAVALLKASGAKTIWVVNEPKKPEQ